MRIKADDTPVDVAAICVAGALRPRTREAIAHRASWPNRDHKDVVYAEIADAIAEHTLSRRSEPWWSATGNDLTAALMVVTDANEGLASHLIAAALHAHVLAGEDTAPDNVLRLAERAASWCDGHLAASDEQTTPEPPEAAEAAATQT